MDVLDDIEYLGVLLVIAVLSAVVGLLMKQVLSARAKDDCNMICDRIIKDGERRDKSLEKIHARFDELLSKLTFDK